MRCSRSHQPPCQRFHTVPITARLSEGSSGQISNCQYGPERVWEPDHEVHHCWLLSTVCEIRMCVKKVRSSAHQYFVHLTDECQVQNRPCLLLEPSTKVDWCSTEQTRLRIFSQFSASLAIISFVEIPHREVQRHLSTSTATFGLGILRQKRAHIH